MTVPVNSDDTILGGDFSYEYTDVNIINAYRFGVTTGTTFAPVSYICSGTYGAGTPIPMPSLVQCYGLNNVPGQQANIGQYKGLVSQNIAGSGMLTFVQGTKLIWSTVGSPSPNCAFRVGEFPVVEQGYFSWCLNGVAGELIKIDWLQGALNAPDGELLDGLYYNLNPGVTLLVSVFTAVGAPLISLTSQALIFGYNNS